MSPAPLNVWFIDDDDFEHLFVRKAIERRNIPFHLRGFTTARDAQAAFETVSPEDFPHLILCDLSMPEMTGLDFVQWLRASPYRAVPLVMRTNSAERRDIERAYELGVTAFYTKAHTIDGIGERLHMNYQYWSRMQLPSPALLLETVRAKS
jgi:CheY-like chemotaxis protein